MYIESRNNFVRLNVAQEVMRFAVSKQAEFVDTMTQQAEEARKEAAKQAAADKEANGKRNGQPEVQAISTSDQQPQKVAGTLGVAVDIQV